MALNITTYRLPDGVSSKVEKGALAILTEELANVGADGDFLATAKEQITIRNFRFKYVRFENGQIICKVKPGDNSTAWTWHVTPPNAEHGEQIGRLLSGEPDPLALLTNPDSLAVPEEVEEEVDAAIAEAPAPAPAAPAGTVEEKYLAVQEAAQPYQARLDKIEALREEVQIMFQTIEDKEKQIKDLEIASEKDSVGKDAYEKFHRIKQLLEL